MTRTKTMRSALGASLVLGLGAAALSASPAAAQPSTGDGAYLEVPAGRAFPAGNSSIDSANVTLSGTDQGFTVTMVVGSDTYELELTPRTGTSFGLTDSETTTVATPTADDAAMTLTRTGSLCTNPTGSFTIDDAAYSGGGPAFNIDRVALRFTIQCSEDTATSAEGFAYVNQNLGPLGTPAVGEFQSMAPVRLLDTRETTKMGPDSTRDVDITGNSSGVPPTAQAVVLNVTAVNPDTATFLSAYPTGSTRPNVSNLNPRATDTVANLATVKVGTGNSITLYNAVGNTDAVVDVVGFYVADDNAIGGGSRYVSQTPVRKLDTREAPATSMTEGETRTLDLGVTADAAIVNLTVTNPTKGGYLTVFPDGVSTAPLASNLNFVSTQTIANLAIVKLDAGKLKLFNPAGTTDVIVDLLGTFEADAANASAGRYVAIDPVRTYDSRDAGQSKLTPGETRKLNLLWENGKYPFEYVAAAANLTATDTTTAGYFTAFPASESTPPFASNLNWLAGETRPNQIVSGTDDDGFTAFFNAAGQTNMIVDVGGFFTR
jgi:hypothetical protein